MVQAKLRGLCIATRCATVEDFVARFHSYCDETSIFVTTKVPRDAGAESQFAILLADKTPVMRGCCVVLEAWTDANNRYGRPGMRLGVNGLTPSSKRAFEALLAARRTTITKDAPPIKSPVPLPTTRTITVRVPEIKPKTSNKPAVGVTGSAIAVPRTISVRGTQTQNSAALLEAPTEGLAQPFLEAMALARTDTALVEESPARTGVGTSPPRELADGSVPLPRSAIDAIESPGSAGVRCNAQRRAESIDAPVVAVVAEGSRETRTRGSDVVLAGNAMTELSDASIAGFSDLVTVTTAGFQAPHSLARSTRPPTLERAEPWCTPTREVDAARLLELVRQTKSPAAEDEPVPSLVVTGWQLVAVIAAAAIALASAVTFVVAS